MRKCIRKHVRFAFIPAHWLVLLEMIWSEWMKESEIEKEREEERQTKNKRKIVFQMFTSQEVAVGLTSKVFKEIPKLEKQKFTFNKREGERRKETERKSEWMRLACTALKPNISILIYGRNCWFQFLFLLSLSLFIVAFATMNMGFAPHIHSLRTILLPDFFSALILSPFIRLSLARSLALSFSVSVYVVFFHTTALHVKARDYNVHVCVDLVTKEMEVFTIYLHEHGLSMNYRKSVLIYGRNVARNTLLTSFVFIHLHFLQVFSIFQP